MSVLNSLGLEKQAAFQMRLFFAALRAMQLGVRVDLERRAQITTELGLAIEECDAFISSILGHPLNVRSSPQMAKLFYTDLAQKPVMSRAKKNQPSHVSCDDEALQVVAKREPLLRPLVDKILHRRSVSVLKTSFAEARLGEDGRMRCSMNICGTETFRLATSQDAFGSGLNMTTIPDDKTQTAIKAGLRGETVPNVKRMFVPDEGYTFFDLDLKKADLQVVAKEAEDTELMAILQSDRDVHAENAKLLGCDYKLARIWVHATNYGASSRTSAAHCGITVQTSDLYRSRWFAAHPGILRWQNRVEGELRAKHEVSNAFGYRRHYFDRVDGLLPEALAWGPQSTVACTINRAWVALHDASRQDMPDLQVLLQVHDSLSGQFLTRNKDTYLPIIHTLSLIPIPYPTPLVIPLSIKTSTKSWGDCV